MEKNYLPSKQFVIKVIVIIILVAGVFSIYKVIKLIKNKPAKDNSVKLVEVIQKVQNDGNNNGIPDWEEHLWGLDPNKNGAENKEYITTRRKALNPNVDLSAYDKKTVSENENLTRAFFSVIMSLQQTGNLDETAMESVASAYSQNIEANPIDDIYSQNQLKIIDDSEENVTTYYKNIQKLISKYEDRDIGSELGLIVQGIAYNDPQVLYATQTVAVAYREFGEELIKISTPESLAGLSLDISNNCEKVAQSIYGITQLFEDPIIAMRAITNYKRYHDALGFELETISSVFNDE